VRIVAGEFKGRRLHGPEGSAARPTSDKVREALFSILGDISGARMLDLFAGTGAVALEALSRGAAHAVMVERDRRMAAVAARNLAAALGGEADRAELIRDDALKFLARPRGGPFDLVFLDPPYADAERLAPKISAGLGAVLAPGAAIAAESDRRAPLALDESRFALRSEHRYGDTLIRIFDSP
jgi:16S rRNA (guanine966-N2)-methyltransferase